MHQGNFGVHILYANGDVDIKPFSQDGATYFPLRHNSEYKILMENNGDTQATAEVSIDGKSIGKFRIDAHDAWAVERPSGVARKLKFVKEKSFIADIAGVRAGAQANGLLRVRFEPERQRVFREEVFAESPMMTMGMRASTASVPERKMMSAQPQMLSMASPAARMSSGATILGDGSGQQFTLVDPLTDIDYSQVQVFVARLVADDGPIQYSHPPPYLHSPFYNQMPVAISAVPSQVLSGTSVFPPRIEDVTPHCGWSRKHVTIRRGERSIA